MRVDHALFGSLNTNTALALGALGGVVVGLVVGYLLAKLGRRGTHVPSNIDPGSVEAIAAKIASQALDQNSERFLTLADERFRRANDAMVNVVQPLERTLAQYQNKLDEIELNRNRDVGAMDAQIRALMDAQRTLEGETHQLVNALRSSSTRGRWGEIQLRRVVELAGMLSHCDFEEQKSYTYEDARVRPDLVVHLPGGRSVVIDAKVPLNSYLSVLEPETQLRRQTAIAGHAKALRNHVDELAKRKYAQAIPGAFDDVIVFVPMDALLAVAFEGDPTLQEYALSKHVLLATPTTLIAMLRTMAYYWREDALVKTAKRIQELGNELYQRLGTMGGHFSEMGRSLSQSVSAFNKAMGSLDSRVFATARKFTDFGLGAGLKGPEEIASIDLSPRELHAGEFDQYSTGLDSMNDT
jgi:DNA recombination protein RmuC